jgi:tRNA threonylcarbamoyladenosine biosynthesis protein TsaE
VTCDTADTPPEPGRDASEDVGAPITVRTASAEQTKDLAGALARALRAGDVVLLAGDLGAGKTTFTKGLAEALGITEPVTSPTFTLVRTYPTVRDAGEAADPRSVRNLVHADIFRLDHLREVADLAIAEMLEDGAAAVVEWGDLAAPVLGRDALVVNLAHGSTPDDRCVSFRLTGCWQSRRGELVELLRRWSVERARCARPG